MTKHLALFDVGTADKFFSGKKSVEGRFSQDRIVPFGQVSTGDTVLIKESGQKKIVGQFIVDRVISFDHPTKEEFETVKKQYGGQMAVDKNFWWSRERVNYATLIFVRRVEKFLVPPIVKHSDRRGWVVLE